MSVRPKKHLGQHFLTDLNIARNIAGALTGLGYKNVLEVGPGMGVLTHYLLQKDYTIHAIEVDEESIDYLQHNYPKLSSNLVSWRIIGTDYDDADLLKKEFGFWGLTLALIGYLCFQTWV